MHIDRIYERYLTETPTEVVVHDGTKCITLDRNRMYNSHIDIRGYLYTDYHEKEYKQKDARNPDNQPANDTLNKQLTPTQRAAAAKKGWEARKKRGL